jgi:N-acetylneuraminic acid mutarotase
MPYPVVLAASAVVDNRIYVIGGQDEFLGSKQNPVSPNVQFNQIYNTATNSWSIGQSLPQTVWQAVGAATTGMNSPKKVYVIGGLDGTSGSPTATNQIYNPDINSWTLGAAFPTTHDYVTNTLATIDLNDSIYVIGGIARANEGFYEITEQYVPTDYNGTVLPQQPISTPTPTSSSSATNSPIESVSPTPSVPEFQLWTILAVILISAISAGFVNQEKKPAHE